jgi:hypothetical protein
MPRNKAVDFSPRVNGNEYGRKERLAAEYRRFLVPVVRIRSGRPGRCVQVSVSAECENHPRAVHKPRESRFYYPRAPERR